VTIRDMMQLFGAATLLIMQFVSIRVAMALRERDREDFEFLRSDHEALKRDHYAMMERIARLEGRE
jgi:hypothetical protein